jgi:hypothetical protein
MAAWVRVGAILATAACGALLQACSGEETTPNEPAGSGGAGGGALNAGGAGGTVLPPGDLGDSCDTDCSILDGRIDAVTDEPIDATCFWIPDASHATRSICTIDCATESDASLCTELGGHCVPEYPVHGKWGCKAGPDPGPLYGGDLSECFSHMASVDCNAYCAGFGKECNGVTFYSECFHRRGGVGGYCYPSIAQTFLDWDEDPSWEDLVDSARCEC